MIENLFGRVYTPIGSYSEDLLLKTKGQVKIQWGNKYIDLIKDGNINFPKESIQKLIDQSINKKIENLQEFPTNAIILYKGTEAPELWTKVDLETGIDGYIYIKKL